MSDINSMIGKTPTEISGEVGGDEIIFTFSDGTIGRFYHPQDCCEWVDIEDITGDWSDLIGNPILEASERVSVDEAPASSAPRDDSNTWTFYTFRGIGGTVDVRWHGSSNGYYSERVDFHIS